VEVHDSVIIVPADPSWPVEFEHAKADLEIALGGRALAMEHIGSTAVPGLAAKPIIDVLIGVAKLEDADPCVAILTRHGWEFPREYNETLEGRRFFLKRDAKGVRTHHAHFVVHEGALWNGYITFRDALRSSDEVRDRYEKLKRELAEKFHDQRERYTASKTDFVNEVLRMRT